MDNLLLRRRQMMASVLPAGYTKLEYLENISDSYIYLSQTSGIKVGWRIIAEVQGTGDKGFVFGFDQDYTGSGLLDFGISFFMGQYFSGTSLDKTIVDMRWESVEGEPYWKAICKINGEELFYNYTRLNEGVITVFQGRGYPSLFNYWLGKIYSFKMYKDGALRYNLIPAKDSNDICGMWDSVSHTFLTSSSGNPFTGA